MMMAIKNVAHRSVRKSLRELSGEPGGEVRADRIGQDDAGRSHQKHGVVVVVLGAIEVAADADDAAHRRTLRLLCIRCGHNAREKPGGKQACIHKSISGEWSALCAREHTPSAPAQRTLRQFATNEMAEAGGRPHRFTRSSPCADTASCPRGTSSC